MAKRLALIIALPVVISSRRLKNGWDTEDFGADFDETAPTDWSSNEKPPDKSDLGIDDGTIRDYHDEEHYQEYVDLLWAVTRYKQLMKGLGDGFYDNPDELISPTCLDVDGIRALDNLMEGFRHGTTLIDKVAKSLTAIVTLFVSVFNNCRATQFFYDLISICFMTNTCTSWEMIANVSANISDITISAGQLILNIVLFWTPSKLEELSAKYYGVG